MRLMLAGAARLVSSGYAGAAGVRAAPGAPGAPSSGGRPPGYGVRLTALRMSSLWSVNRAQTITMVTSDILPRHVPGRAPFEFRGSEGASRWRISCGRSSDLRGSHFSMSKRRAKPIQFPSGTSAIMGSTGWGTLGGNPLGELRVFAGLASPEALQERLREEVGAEVAAMADAVREFDAFDVIELMRLREIPVAPVVALITDHDGIGAAIDLVSLVCLSRPSRGSEGKARESTKPHHAIDDLHARATRLLRLAQYMHSGSAMLTAHDPLARLASEYQSYLVGVRNLRYDSIEADHDTALFGRTDISALLREHLGFTFGEFTAVRSAIQERYSRTLTSLRDKAGDIMMRCRAEGREPTEDEVQVFRESMSDMMFRPGKRASFTVSGIAAESGLGPDRVEAVLSAFSIEFDGTWDAASKVSAFLRGINPLGRTCLIRDADGNYLMTGNQIGTDSFRVIAENALKTDNKVWHRYDRARADVSETAALAAVSRALSTPATYPNLSYYAPRQGQDVTGLDAACPNPQAVGDPTECDGLFVIEDVAICVEVKGRTIADPARRGDRARLTSEIKKIFSEGARQAQRLEQLIARNRGVWLGDGSWLDLSTVREARAVVVGLDDFGPLAVALGDLQQAGLLGEGSLPWITSLHDLEVISRVIDRPAEFLLWLRRRADSGVARYYRGSDELDLFMLFLDGGLYVEPDPDEVQRDYPTSGPARSHDRKKHQRDARPTIIGTHTDPLDAWMYWTEGTSPYEADKPALNTYPAAQEIVDFLADGRKPGWLRFGADVLGLAGTAQKKLGDSLRDIAHQVRADGQWHTLVFAYAGLWGHPTLFAATQARNQTRGEAMEKLRTYMTAKKHQLRSDRSLGLLLGPRRQIVGTVYMNDAPGHDPGLDSLGDAIGLMSIEESHRPVPPSARRATRRLRGQRKKDRRRR